MSPDLLIDNALRATYEGDMIEETIRSAEGNSVSEFLCGHVASLPFSHSHTFAGSVLKASCHLNSVVPLL